MTEKEVVEYMALLRLRVTRIEEEKRQARRQFCQKGFHDWCKVEPKSRESGYMLEFAQYCWLCGEPKPVEKAKDGVSKNEEKGK